MEGWERALLAVGGFLAGGAGLWIVSVLQAWWKARSEKSHQDHTETLEDRKQRHDLEQEDRDDAWKKQREIIRRQDKQLATHQENIDRLLLEGIMCRQESAANKAAGTFLYGLVKLLHREVIRLGGNPGPLPEFRIFEEVSETARAANEFTSRSTTHATGILHDEAKGVLREADDDPASR